MRLIDADALIAAIKEDALNTLYSYNGEILRLLCLEIEEAPTVDPESLVKRGRWKNGAECSECGQVDCTKPNFCPNCGAKMEDA